MSLNFKHMFTIPQKFWIAAKSSKIPLYRYHQIPYEFFLDWILILYHIISTIALQVYIALYSSIQLYIALYSCIIRVYPLQNHHSGHLLGRGTRQCLGWNGVTPSRRLFFVESHGLSDLHLSIIYESSICISVSLYLCIFVSLYLCIFVSIYLSICPVWLFVRLSIMWIYLYIYISVYLYNICMYTGWYLVSCGSS